MKYKVGDKVKVINSDNYTHRFNIGEIVTITEVYDNQNYYKAKNSKDFWYVGDEDIEGVERMEYEVGYWTDEMLEPAEEKKETEIPCHTCEHEYDTCFNCNAFDKWEPKEGIKTFPQYPKIEKFKKLQQEELELYELKNAKYGDSFGISVQKYGLISALTRMSDKWNRIENLILNHDNGTDDESLLDSLKDLSNYCNMTVIELENKNGTN